MTPVEFPGNFRRQKTRVPVLSCGVVCLVLRLSVLVEHRLVTDTDRRCGDAFPIERVLVATYLLSVEALPHCRCGVANKS